MEFIIVTGISGAGKSRAISSLEDIGYYCIDNVPPAMLTDFIKLFAKVCQFVHLCNRLNFLLIPI
mgnify:CR=1 FL=1